MDRDLPMSLNTSFLEDLKNHQIVDNGGVIDERAVQLYIALKLWSIEQLLKHTGGR